MKRVKFPRFLRIALGLAIPAMPIAALALHEVRHAALARAIDQSWTPAPVGEIAFSASVNAIAITPLSNWRTSGPQFVGEPGVSYLIETDRGRILFDVGFNQNGSDPSPLERNMRTLGITRDRFDAIFISHLHRDHVGDLKWEQQRSFSIGIRQDPLDSKRIFAPVPMAYPGSRVEVIANPTELMPGIATSGGIARQLAIGRVEEQALVLNLEGHGLVVIVGCGHQTLPRLLERIHATFRKPIYAIVGDLHYPIAHGRLFIAGIDAQRRLASGNGVLNPITPQAVDKEIRSLRGEVQRVVIGGHDTGDEALGDFSSIFGADFVEARVGETVTFITRAD